MLDAQDAVELRALQARAYGRAGALSDAEAARLGELEAARTSESESQAAKDPRSEHVDIAPSADPSVASVPATAASAAARFAGADTAAPSGQGTGSDADSQGESLATALRRHWRLALVITVGVAVIGVAAGWLLFSDRGAAPVQLTAEQQEWQRTIVASGDFDSGSLRAMAEEEGVVISFATKNGGADVCLVLASADATAPACTTREQATIQGVNATLTKAVDASQSYDIQAQMFLTPDGRPAVIARSYITSPQSTSMFASQAEAEAAAALAEKTGLDSRSIMVAGYDDDVPIWTGIDMSTQRYCLVYDGSMPDPPMVCDDSLMLADADRTLVLEVTGVEDGEITRYEYRFSYGQQYLTVTKGSGADDAAGE
ncbi:hypothetical protein [Microbacterium sp. Leaf320]|uniref:hypothetical protein n=1 Tax=Microbacterium sp. Leaf320 TaxID=1736334 RepID=UPI0006F1C7E2|nr:hypothetical protein [Microbacterium sp. Leaf320]KQQ68498.1 hypothetical protein ASF63_00315 [Microbacterium sp. Leaf320]